MKKFDFLLFLLVSFITIGCSGSNNDDSDGSSQSVSSTGACTIVWQNYDGSVLEVDRDVQLGSMPSYDGATPKREASDNYDYVFSGWTPDVVPVTEDAVYVATFDSMLTAAYVSFDLDGGKTSSDTRSRYISSIDAKNFFFNVTKDGYNFRGWEYNGQKIFDGKGNKLKNVAIAEKMTFKAVFAQTAYLTISSNMSGAAVIKGEGEYAYNTSVVISVDVNDGYSFLGWYYEDGTLLSNQSIYPFMMWNEDVSIIAKFAYASYTLRVESYNVNLGKVTIKNTSRVFDVSQEAKIKYQSKVTIAAYTSTEVGFLGWFDSEGKLIETNAVYEFVMPHEDYTLIAKWNLFKIEYNLNGGTQNPDNPTSYTADSGTLPLYAPMKPGYAFLGWRYGSDFVSSIDPSLFKNVTLDAVWEATTYSISYHLDGGINDHSNPSSYTIESDDIALSSPSKAGYAFDGWYSDSAHSEKVAAIKKGSYGDVDLYAKWTAITYSITYDLNGGIDSSGNPSSYTVEDSLSLSAPTKAGYTFLGWYSGGKQIAYIEKGTIGNLELAAKWTAIAYSITYDLNGGTQNPDNPTSYTADSGTLPLYAPMKPGYAFLGWRYGSDFVSSIDPSLFKNVTLDAVWEATTYSISYHLDGGINDHSNPSSYTIESDDIALSSPSKAGYAFDGWYSDSAHSEKVAAIKKGSYGDLNLYAKWSANLNALSVTSGDEGKGTVEIVSGSGYTDETVTVKATPLNGGTFAGWHSGSQWISGDEVYSFTMPAGGYSLVARFYSKAEINLGVVPAINGTEGTLTYGLYPQTHVSDAATVAALGSLTSADINGWYFYDGQYYAKETAKPYGSSDVFDDGTEIVSGTSYWFKCEPIEWKVLSFGGGSYSLVSAALLDAHRYDDSSNNYANSEIREWLNGDFFSSAFALNDSHIQTTMVDNSASTTDSSGNKYACENTEDKVYLLSYQDYKNASYFADDAARRCKMTDYARARGAWYSTDPSYLYNGFYWTRSPYSGYSNSAWYVYSGGNLNSSYVYISDSAVRPALNVNL